MLFDKSKTSNILIIIHFTATNPTEFHWKTNCESESQSSDSDGDALEGEDQTPFGLSLRFSAKRMG